MNNKKVSTRKMVKAIDDAIYNAEQEGTYSHEFLSGLRAARTVVGHIGVLEDIASLLILQLITSGITAKEVSRAIGQKCFRKHYPWAAKGEKE